jgi:hypothetical protein
MSRKEMAVAPWDCVSKLTPAAKRQKDALDQVRLLICTCITACGACPTKAASLSACHAPHKECTACACASNLVTECMRLQLLSQLTSTEAELAALKSSRMSGAHPADSGQRAHSASPRCSHATVTSPSSGVTAIHSHWNVQKAQREAASARKRSRDCQALAAHLKQQLQELQVSSWQKVACFSLTRSCLIGMCQHAGVVMQKKYAAALKEKMRFQTQAMALSQQLADMKKQQVCTLACKAGSQWLERVCHHQFFGVAAKIRNSHDRVFARHRICNAPCVPHISSDDMETLLAVWAAQSCVRLASGESASARNAGRDGESDSASARTAMASG